MPQPTFFQDASVMSVSYEKKGTVKTGDVGEGTVSVLRTDFASTFAVSFLLLLD